MTTHHAARRNSVNGDSPNTGHCSNSIAAIKMILQRFLPCGGSAASVRCRRIQYLLLWHDSNAHFGAGGLHFESVNTSLGIFILCMVGVVFKLAYLSGQYENNLVLGHIRSTNTIYQRASTHNELTFANEAAITTRKKMRVVDTNPLATFGNGAVCTSVVTLVFVADMPRPDSFAGFYWETLYPAIPSVPSYRMRRARGQRGIYKETTVSTKTEERDLYDQICVMTDEDQVNIHWLLPSVRLGVLFKDVCLGMNLSAGLHTSEQPVEAGPGGEGDPTSGGGQGGSQGGGGGSKN